MKRSSSMENITSILPPLPATPPPSRSNLTYRVTSTNSCTSPSDILWHPINNSNRLSLSSSPSTPSSAISYGLEFFSNSPGIPLVSGLLGQEAKDNLEDVGWSQIDQIMTDSVANSLEGQAIAVVRMVSSAHSLDSISDGAHSTISLDPLTAIESCLSANHVSDPNLCGLEERRHSVEVLKSVHVHQRSFSAEESSFDKENRCLSRIHITNNCEDNSHNDLDEGVGTIGSRTELAVSSPDSVTENSTGAHFSSRAEKTDIKFGTSGIEALSDGRVLDSAETFESPEFIEAPRGLDISAGTDPNISPTLLHCNDSMTTLVGTPHPENYSSVDEVFAYVDRRQELPAISEETEDNSSRRMDKRRLGTDDKTSDRKCSFDLPLEPDELAPGTFSSSMGPSDWSQPSPPMAPSLHRRAISDQLGTNLHKSELRRTREMEEIDRIGLTTSDENMEDVLLRTRKAIGRASSINSDRCKSQVLLYQTSNADDEASVILDRNLSSSDPAVNEDRAESRGDHGPPPVLLTRKVSIQNSDSWKKHFPVGAAHSVFTPSSLQARQNTTRSTTVIDLHAKPGDRSRIEKKKEKGSSETFSFGSLFGTGRNGKQKKKPASDRSLENVLSSFHMRAGGVPVSLPSRRVAIGDGHSIHQRPPIPEFDGFPDHLSRVLSSPSELSQEVEESLVDSPDTSKYLDLRSWSRFDLFSKDEYMTWHDKFRHDKLNPKVIKKQDAIYELILIEKQHCANLAFLQQAYRNRLLEENILTPVNVDRLIPDVLDSLLVFHTHLLDRLTSRQKESDEVETISDILAEELSDEGKHTIMAINAYTSFGTAKEQSEQFYGHLLHKSARFSEFMKECSRDPIYRQFEFKTTMTKIISRPAKYGLLLDSILKNEANMFSKGSELTQKASAAAKRFALKIDNNLCMTHMARRWDEVRSLFDLTSQTNLFMVDKSKPGGVIHVTFTIEDLNIDMKSCGMGERRLMCLGEVVMKMSGGTNKVTDWGQQVFMVLFDDLLVCLQRRSNGKYIFIPQEQAVFPVSSLILRVPDRSPILVMSGAKPVLLEFQFLAKTDRAKWIKTLEAAIHSAPLKVRMSARNEGEAAQQMKKARILDEKRQIEAEEAWLKKLEEMFAERKNQEYAIVSYMETRMKFFDGIRTHMNTLPFKSRLDIQDRIKEAVRLHFKELRLIRTAPLNRLISNATIARESDLWSFIDNQAEAADIDLDDSDGSGSSSDSSGAGKGHKPRRIQTFHGTTGPGPSISKEKSNFRRHTTVPRMSLSQDSCFERNDSGEERIMDQEVDRKGREEIEERTHKLPLGLNLKARRASTRLIRDVVKLKTENNILRNELSLNKTRLAMLERTRSATTPTMVVATDTMEVLRKKEQEVREEDARRRKELEIWAEQLKKTEEDLEQERELLRRNEIELAEKWSALKEAAVRDFGGQAAPIIGRMSVSTSDNRNRVASFRDLRLPPTSQQIELTPALLNLTKKSEMKKIKK